MRGQSFLLLFFLSLLLLISVPVAGQNATTERSFTWAYAGRTWSLTHRFSTAHYQFFRTRPRILDYANYTEYVNDPRDDEQLQSLLDGLERLASDAGLNSWERLNLVVAFVQAIPYVNESCEYPRYPLEMLVEQRGDCEDASILAAALLRQMRFDVILLAYLGEDHMALGIRVDPPTKPEDPPILWNGGSYYYVEPTSIGWAIGEVPDRYRSRPTILALQPVYASSSKR